MKDYLPFIIIGLTTGSVYGLSAIGLVLTYKTSGLFNFGHGAVAATAAVIFYELRQVRGLPWPIAALLAVIGFGVVAGILMERLATGLSKVPTTYRIVATTGLVLAVPGIVALVYGPSARGFNSFLPRRVAFTVAGVQVGYDALITAGLGIAAAAALYGFLRSSRLGKSMRAVVDRPELLDLTGESPTRVRRISWLIGSSFAAVSGVLLAGTQQQLDATLLSLLVVQAFGAAAIGAFTSLPMAYAGGLTVGVVAAVIGRLAADHPVLRGIDFNIPFLFLFIGLLVIPKHKLVELGQRVPISGRSGTPLDLPRRYRNVAIGVVLAIAVVVPHVVGTRLPAWNGAMAQLLLFLSLGLLVNTSGQISLCHVGFAAVGATSFAHLLDAGVPWGLAVLAAGLVLVPIGAVVSIPAIRLSGLFLGLATLGFGILLAQFFYSKEFMFGRLAMLPVRRPAIAGLESDTRYYYLLLAFGIAGIAVVTLLERSRLGRILRGLSASPTALATLGANTNIPRVMIFCLSAFMAGVSGALGAGLFSSITPDAYNYVRSLLVLAALVICGQRTVFAGVVASLAYTLPTGYLQGDDVSAYMQLAFGGFAIVVALLANGRATDIARRVVARSADRSTSSPVKDRSSRSSGRSVLAPAPGL